MLTETSVAILHQHAVALYEQPQFEKAVQLFRLLTITEPNQSEFWYALGSSLMLSGKPEEALQPLKIASIHNDQDKRPLEALIACYNELERQDEAKTISEQLQTLRESYGET